MSLRRRVTLATTAVGFALSLLFSLAVDTVTEDYEHIIAGEILQGQADDYGLRLANHLPATLPQTHRLSGYHVDSPDMPPALLSKGPGVHELEDGVHVGVFDTRAGRLAFVIDLRDIEQLERHLRMFLAAMIVVGTGLAGWLGWMLSGSALQPLARLAAGVHALPVRPVRSHLAEGVSDDELGEIAHAVDAYQGRLVEADEREQAFLADASHELRTPITVAQGVAEVMLDAPTHANGDLARLQRLQRALQDMSGLLESLLGIARRTPLTMESLDLRVLMHEAADAAFAGRPAAPEVVIDAEGVLRAPRREALLLMRGLMRKAATAGGVLRVHADATGFRIDGAGSSTTDASARSDRGGAGALLDRLAQRLGWTVHDEAAGAVRLDWSSPATE